MLLLSPHQSLRLEVILDALIVFIRKLWDRFTYFTSSHFKGEQQQGGGGEFEKRINSVNKIPTNRIILNFNTWNWVCVLGGEVEFCFHFIYWTRKYQMIWKVKYEYLIRDRKHISTPSLDCVGGDWWPQIQHWCQSLSSRARWVIRGSQRKSLKVHFKKKNTFCRQIF